MFKSRVTKAVVAFSSYTAAVLTAPQQVLAQLNVGRYGIQPGLEPNYLQYQLSGQDLNKLRAIPGCNIGFGAGCDKSASVLQQIVESNNGLSYNDLIMRAAGGQSNYQNFASYYGNNPNLSLVPYASFWANDDPYILDGYRYLLGQPVTRTPVQGLGQVTRNFYWSPQVSGNSESLRDGLLDLKYSYGRLLLEEVAKIPNAREQIQSLNLPQNVKQFYLNNLNQGLRALNSGNEAQLKDEILEVLSLPFTQENAEYGRPILGIPEEYSQFTGTGVPGDVIAGVPPLFPTPEVTGVDTLPILSQGEVITQGRRGGGFPLWVLGAIPLALLPFLFGGGDDDNSRDVAFNPPPPVGGEQPPNTPPPSGEQPPVTPPPGGEQPPSIPPPTGEQPPSIPPPTGEQPPVTPPPRQIPEPSTLTPMLLLGLMMSVRSYKKWQKQGCRE